MLQSSSIPLLNVSVALSSRGQLVHVCIRIIVVFAKLLKTRKHFNIIIFGKSLDVFFPFHFIVYMTHGCYTVGNRFSYANAGHLLRNWSFDVTPVKWNGWQHETLWNSIHLVRSPVTCKMKYFQCVFLSIFLWELVEIALQAIIGKTWHSSTAYHWSQFSTEPATTRVSKLIKLLFIFIRIYLIVLFILDAVLFFLSFFSFFLKEDRESSSSEQWWAVCNAGAMPFMLHFGIAISNRKWIEQIETTYESFIIAHRIVPCSFKLPARTYNWMMLLMLMMVNNAFDMQYT